MERHGHAGPSGELGRVFRPPAIERQLLHAQIGPAKVGPAPNPLPFGMKLANKNVINEATRTNVVVTNAGTVVVNKLATDVLGSFPIPN